MIFSFKGVIKFVKKKIKRSTINNNSNSKSNINNMFKSKFYNVKKESEKNDKAQPQSSKTQSNGTMTLKKKEKIKALNNYSPPAYRQPVFPKKTVTKWTSNKTYEGKKEKEKEKGTKPIPKPHKKLERK